MKDFLSDRRLWIVRGIIICLLGGIAIGLWQLFRTGFFDGGGWLWPVFGMLILLGLLPLLGLLGKHKHRGVLVLWCRRFSEPNLEVGNRNRWIWAVITEACRDTAIPVTLRDQSLAGSQNVGRSIQNPLSVLLIIAGTPLWLVVMLWALKFVDGSLPEFAVCAVGLVGYVLMFRLIGFVVTLVTSTIATFDGNPEAIRQRLKRLKQSRSNRRDLDAIRCTDENWQDCVLAVLGEVDFVIIDNADSSENIDWEIQQSISHVGKDRVFMLLRPDSKPPPNVTVITLDFDEATEEIEGLQADWGEDDFGEAVVLGVIGQNLAASLQGKLRDANIRLVNHPK